MWGGGGNGSGQGIACHTMTLNAPEGPRAGHIAVVVSAHMQGSAIRVDSVAAYCDIGRIINRDIARQQIEGGLMFGIAHALGGSARWNAGLPQAGRLAGLGLPLLADCPKVAVAFATSDAEPFDPGELGMVAIAPLYPHYSGATTASVLDDAARWILRTRRLPALRTLPPYHDDPGYIAALHQDLSRQIAALDFAPELLMLSYHGMPERTLHMGDPYHCHCRKTSRLLGDAFAATHPELRLMTTFQSRFGRAKWLEPATDEMLMAEARAGTRRVAIAAPGFSADCLETLEELAIRGREEFTGAGGTEFAALGCLNAGTDGMALLDAMVRRELSGWI